MHLPGLDDVEQKCWHQFLDSSTLLLAMLNQRLTDAHGLTLFDVLLLDLLARSDRGAARMSELAEGLMLIPSRVTWQIRRLETRGLVSRSPSRHDRRGVLATITREGQVQVRAALRTYAAEIRTHYLGQMSRQQMIALGDNCRRINAPLQASGRPAKFRRV